MNKKTVRIGTRGSQLALFQAELTRKKLLEKFPETNVEIVIIKTKGDKILDVALSKIGDKGVFTKEIEKDLLDGKIDMAVHSLKDLPTSLPEGLKLGAVLERGEFRDALICKDGRTLDKLTENDVIATSSLRRKASLLKYNKNFRVIDIRGNVNTRLRKMEEGYCDAMIMAATGFQRLGLEKYITEIIQPEIIIPATSQGIIAIESRTGDTVTDELLKGINHTATWEAAEAERGFLHAVEGGCQVPVGCYSQFDGEHLSLTGFVASIDGTTYLSDTETGSAAHPAAVGEKLAQKLIARGAAKMIEAIRTS